MALPANVWFGMIGALSIIGALITGSLVLKGKISLSIHKIFAAIVTILLIIHSYLALKNFI